MNKSEFIRVISVPVIMSISVSTISRYLEIKSGIVIFNTALWWFFHAVFLATMFFFKGKIDLENRKSLFFIKIYLMWNIFCITRGFFVAENYWDWKGLANNGMALLIPIVSFFVVRPINCELIFRAYFRYTLPLFLILYFLIDPDSYGFFLVPIIFIALFIPILPMKWKCIVIFLIFLVIFSDLGARSNVIKFAVPLIFSLFFYFRKIISLHVFNFLRISFFIIPITFFILAISSEFNIFKSGDYFDIELTTQSVNSHSATSEENLTADTRTFLYEDVLNTARIYNSWLIGRTPARGNISEAFGMDDETGRGERLGNEVSILNVFTWTGFVGVVLHFLVFYRASYLAVNNSKNIFIKILGIFVAFRWTWAWVEDINYFTLTTVFLWIIIGICCSKYFRSMHDSDFKFWIRGIF